MLDEKKLAEDHVYGEIVEDRWFKVMKDVRKFANWLHNEGLITDPTDMTDEQLFSLYNQSDDSEIL